MASVRLQATSEVAWTVCEESPAAAEKHPKATIPPTIDGAPPFTRHPVLFAPFGSKPLAVRSVVSVA